MSLIPSMPARPALQLSGVEILANLPLGPVTPSPPPLPPPDAGGIRAALDAIIVPALERPPCLVSFSGGRDSSAVLALACDTARRFDLPPPVPVIMRFPGVRTSDESRWQELVLTHVGVRPEVLTLRDELDVLGELGTGILRRHGLHWPGNAHMHVPVLAAGRGGTLLTGIGGDELLGTSSPARSWRARAVGAMPRMLRAELLRLRRPPGVGGWLTERGRRRVVRALAQEEARWPYQWDRALDYWYRSRAFAALDGTLARVGADWQVRVVNPLLAPQVLAELRQMGGPSGFPSRAEGMRRLCGSLLPEAVIVRTTKAEFGGAIWGPAVRRFGATWDGRGVDPVYVDVERMRAQLRSDSTDFRVILLLARAWLASGGAGPTAT